MTKLVRVLLAIGITVVALFGSVYVVVNSLDNDRARKWLFPLVAKYVGYHLEVPGSIDTRLNRYLELELSRGKLKPVTEDTAEGEDDIEKGKEALALNAEWDHVLFRMDLLELLFWQIGLEKIVVDNLEVRVLPAKERNEQSSGLAGKNSETALVQTETEPFAIPINVAVHNLDVSDLAVFLTNEEGMTEFTLDNLMGSLKLSSDKVPILAADLNFGTIFMKAPMTLKEGPVEETIEEVAGTDIPDAESDRDTVIRDLYVLLEQPPLRFDRVKIAVDEVNAGEWKTHSVQVDFLWNASRLEANLGLGKPVSSFEIGVDIPGRNFEMNGDLRHFAIGPVINSVVTFGFLPQSIKKDILTGYLRAFADVKTQGETTDTFIKNLNGKLYVVVEDGSIDSTIVEALGFDIAETVVSLISGNPNTKVNCIVADIDIVKGVVNGDQVVVETNDSKIIGRGNIDPVNSTIDYRLAVEAGDTSPLSVPAPLFFKGPLSSPQISVEKKTLFKEIASVVVQPAVALVEWFRGKDRDIPEKSASRCDALLAH